MPPNIFQDHAPVRRSRLPVPDQPSPTILLPVATQSKDGQPAVDAFRFLPDGQEILLSELALIHSWPDGTITLSDKTHYPQNERLISSQFPQPSSSEASC